MYPKHQIRCTSGFRIPSFRCFFGFKTGARDRYKTGLLVELIAFAIVIGDPFSALLERSLYGLGLFSRFTEPSSDFPGSFID